MLVVVVFVRLLAVVVGVVVVIVVVWVVLLRLVVVALVLDVCACVVVRLLLVAVVVLDVCLCVLAFFLPGACDWASQDALDLRWCIRDVPVSVHTPMMDVFIALGLTLGNRTL